MRRCGDAPQEPLAGGDADVDVFAEDVRVQVLQVDGDVGAEVAHLQLQKLLDQQLQGLQEQDIVPPDPLLGVTGCVSR